MNEAYRNQLRLLLDALPLVAEEKAFALKGGTAINLFERDLPRLSVDIDLTYLPNENRQKDLEAISTALKRIEQRIVAGLKATKVTLVDQGGGIEAKLHVQRGRTQIKVEVNPTIRGRLMPVRTLACSGRVQEMFETFIEVPVVAHGELFGGKLCAALDRQHPRDLFDVKLFLDATGITEEVRLGLIAALVSHGRPIAELIKPSLKNREAAFNAEFEGMALEPFNYDDHKATFVRLIDAITGSLTENDRAFLLAFEKGEPDWSLYPLTGIDALPAVQWKLRNVRTLRDTNPDKHRAAVNELTKTLKTAEDKR